MQRKDSSESKQEEDEEQQVKKEQQSVHKDAQKKRAPERPPPRYMTKLIKTAKLRKAEREVIKEKMIQKEYEQTSVTEQPEKKVYVTSGYLRRMKEREQALKELAS